MNFNEFNILDYEYLRSRMFISPNDFSAYTKGYLTSASPLPLCIAIFMFYCLLCGDRVVLFKNCMYTDYIRMGLKGLTISLQLKTQFLCFA